MVCVYVDIYTDTNQRHRMFETEFPADQKQRTVQFFKDDGSRFRISVNIELSTRRDVTYTCGDGELINERIIHAASLVTITESDVYFIYTNVLHILKQSTLPE